MLHSSVVGRNINGSIRGSFMVSAVINYVFDMKLLRFYYDANDRMERICRTQLDWMQSYNAHHRDNRP
ncbi:uncharacterized protein AKAW2_81328S [Aspergillus luchuensis]|uniref:Uncharacterized protein n=1 Tax=Aspergillus kawachii TaxID=1069201 RepID=A0A7R7WM37_ASPKA|nr:uncharacterized protein AKAW2_81328S [Aspergillus luchuensis]BCS05527.1 hypothetical protein AKAW2_81328S [Aspergillus luchuensis]